MVTGFLAFPNPNLTQSLSSAPGPVHPLWTSRSGGSAHLGPLHSPTHHRKCTQTFPGPPLAPDEDQRGRDQRSLSGPQPLTAGAGECRRARPCPSQAASARPSLASAPRPAPGSAPPWGAGLRAPARTTSLGSAALGRAGTGGRWRAAEELGDSAATAPPPPPRIAGFVLALSLCLPRCSHNAVDFASLNPCGPQSEGSRTPGDYRCGCPALLHPEGPGPAYSCSLQKTLSLTASLAVLLKIRDSKTWKNGQCGEARILGSSLCPLLGADFIMIFFLEENHKIKNISFPRTYCVVCWCYPLPQS